MHVLTLLATPQFLFYYTESEYQGFANILNPEDMIVQKIVIEEGRPSFPFLSLLLFRKEGKTSKNKVLHWTQIKVIFDTCIIPKLCFIFLLWNRFYGEPLRHSLQMLYCFYLHRVNGDEKYLTTIKSCCRKEKDFKENIIDMKILINRSE